MDVLKKIHDLMKKHGYTEYQLSKISGVPQTTINSMFHKKNSPTIPTLESLCKAFGLSLSQFFAEGNSVSELTPEQIKMFEKWTELDDEQKEILMKLISMIKH